jgi:hypothetical protein
MLALHDGVIRYSSVGPVWELRLSALRVIGEYTNANGPYLDDYFLCFATTDSEWYEASFYDEGRDEFLKELGHLLGSDFQLHLVGSTDYASNVLWPPHLAGTPMFTFEPVQATTWLGRLKDRLLGSPIRQVFAEKVLAELQMNEPQMDTDLHR